LRIPINILQKSVQNAEITKSAFGSMAGQKKMRLNHQIGFISAPVAVMLGKKCKGRYIKKITLMVCEPFSQISATQFHTGYTQLRGLMILQ
jgi:hypothetical protein